MTEHRWIVSIKETFIPLLIGRDRASVMVRADTPEEAIEAALSVFKINEYQPTYDQLRATPTEGIPSVR